MEAVYIQSGDDKGGLADFALQHFVYYLLHAVLPALSAVFDFRPYHVGADIVKGMTIPEGEKPTVYETLFIYSKDGREQEFTIDNFPTDTT